MWRTPAAKTVKPPPPYRFHYVASDCLLNKLLDNEVHHHAPAKLITERCLLNTALAKLTNGGSLQKNVPAKLPNKRCLKNNVPATLPNEGCL